MPTDRPAPARHRDVHRSPASPPAAGRNPSLDHPDLQELRRQEAFHDANLDPFGERQKRRWLHYVVGSVIFFPLMTWFFTPAGLEALWFQIPAAAAFGTFFAYYRPTGVTAALATIGTGLAIQAVTDHIAVSFALLMSIICYGAVGYVLGMTEYSKIMEGR